MANAADNFCLLLTNHKQISSMDRTVRHETQCCKAAHKLITSIHSKSYRPLGMLIDRQNSYAPRSKRRIGRREAQSCESVNKVKKTLCISDIESLPTASHKAT
jgi:hypothetical protein